MVPPTEVDSNAMNDLPMTCPCLTRHLLVSGLILGLAAGACSDQKSPDAEVFEDAAGVRHVSVSEDVLPREGYARVVARWNAGGGTDGRFVDIAAATETHDGMFAVLDRFSKTVTILDSEGSIRSTFGREGGGPAEFQDPRDLVALGGELRVWDLPELRALIRLAESGVT